MFPAESVTAEVVELALAHVPTSTTNRFPAVTLEPNAAPNDDRFAPCAVTCCTNPGVATATGVTAFDATEGGLVPTPLVAVTTNVYAVPFDNPDTVAVVGAGEPDTVVGANGVDPTYGVTA